MDIDIDVYFKGKEVISGERDNRKNRTYLIFSAWLLYSARVQS